MDSGYSIALPVFLGDEMDGKTFLLSGETVGTAFPLPGPFMLTAGHVGREILAAQPRIGVVGLKNPNVGGLKGARITDVEELPGDLAVLKVEFPLPEFSQWFHTLSWQQTPLNPFDSVRTMDFRTELFEWTRN